jgi:hypothetical protein
VRILPDGRLFFKWAALKYLQYWPSREAFVQWRKESDAEVARGPVDMTLTLLPPVDDFLRNVEQHAKALGPRLGIPDAALDRTVDERRRPPRVRYLRRHGAIEDGDELEREARLAASAVSGQKNEPDGSPSGAATSIATRDRSRGALT